MAASRLSLDYFAICNGCVSTQRLHHCASAWPYGQALILTFGSLTARVARRAAICQLHFNPWPYTAKHMLSILRLAHRPRCAARQRASIMAISPFSLWLAAFRLLSSYTQLVCAHSDCVIVFQRSLAAMRSLDSLGHLRGTLRSAIGVRPQRLHTCIQAWPCGQALSISFGPLATRVARREAICPLHFSLALRPSTFFLSFGPFTARVARRVNMPHTTIAIEMLAAYDWPHHDCLQITLRSAITVCPHNDCIIAFLGLLRPSVLSL